MIVMPTTPQPAAQQQGVTLDLGRVSAGGLDLVCRAVRRALAAEMGQPPAVREGAERVLECLALELALRQQAQRGGL